MSLFGKEVIFIPLYEIITRLWGASRYLINNSRKKNQMPCQTLLLEKEKPAEGRYWFTTKVKGLSLGISIVSGANTGHFVECGMFAADGCENGDKLIESEPVAQVASETIRRYINLNPA